MVFRYADIMVHRLLAAAIGVDVTYPDMLNSRHVQVGFPFII
jgi:exoribonuclease R